MIKKVKMIQIVQEASSFFMPMLCALLFGFGTFVMTITLIDQKSLGTGLVIFLCVFGIFLIFFSMEMFIRSLTCGVECD